MLRARWSGWDQVYGGASEALPGETGKTDGPHLRDATPAVAPMGQLSRASKDLKGLYMISALRRAPYFMWRGPCGNGIVRM